MVRGLEGAMHCLQPKPYKCISSSFQAAVTSESAKRFFHVLGKNYFMLHKILCGIITAHSPFERSDQILCFLNSFVKISSYQA